MKKISLPLAAALCALSALPAVRARAKEPVAKAAENVREFTLVNLEYEGTKIWLPGLIVAKKGDRVRIQLINNVPSGEHGFSISEFKVVEKVYKGEPRTVEFTADKAGLFRMFCQIHPKHIGGQILVLE